MHMNPNGFVSFVLKGVILAYKAVLYELWINKMPFGRKKMEFLHDYDFDVWSQSATVINPIQWQENTI